MEAEMGVVWQRLIRHKAQPRAAPRFVGNPVRNPHAVEARSSHGVVLSLPLHHAASPFSRWLGRRLPVAVRRFELEGVGARVWDLCDGTRPPKAIAAILKHEYRLNRLEAEAALAAFLSQLAERGLILRSGDR